MDRSELSETIVHELGALFEAEVRAAGPVLVAADLDGMEQRVQQLSRRVCGALIERVLAVRAEAPAPRPPCPACGGLLRLVEQARGRHLQGLTGDVTLRRPTYVCTRTACGQGYAPLDEQLGLGAPTLTPRLARVACRAGITTAFEEAAAHLEEDLGVAVSGETVRRVSEAVGAVAEAQQQAAIAQVQQGRLARPAQGAVDVVVPVDGAEWIWKRAAHFVGGPGITVVEIVDIYHAYDHLWAVGRALWDTPEAVSAWVEPLKDALYTQGAPAVLAALDAVVPSEAAADLVRTTRAYFADNAARMDYPRFVAQQLPIGSGAVESLCKSLIEARLKQAGMRWTPAGAQAIATLRAVQASGQWDAFWATHPVRTHLRLCPPARPRRTARPMAPAP